MSDWTIGIIGGSGLYAIDALENAQWIPVSSPWGEASDEILCGTIGHVRVRFLPRHGRGHRLSPSEVPARANIFALKSLGVERIISVSAVGSLREEHKVSGSVRIGDFHRSAVGNLPAKEWKHTSVTFQNIPEANGKTHGRVRIKRQKQSF